MATDVKKPVSGEPPVHTPEDRVVDTAQQFWDKNSKVILYALAAVILVGGGYFVYRNYFKAPEEQKAAEAIWKAQDYYKIDSFRLALNGDGANQGFLRIISKYGGTQVGNLAKFYAGSSYLHLGDYNNAIKYLKDFSTSEKETQLRATGLLGDAYAESGKKQEAVEHYKKAGTMFEDDDVNSPEYLFRAAMLYQELGKNQEAIDLLNQLKNKYPASPRAYEADKYLGKLGYTK
jgi:TolA-binding protein